MFISKVTLRHGPGFFNLLKKKNGWDGYVAHQLLWGLFPNHGEKKRDFLFHEIKRESTPQFLLVSQEQPVQTDALSVASKPYAPQLAMGQRLAFTLVVNPVVSRKIVGKKNSAKHDVWMDAKWQAKKKGITGQALVDACEGAVKSWLVRQGERCGFQLPENRIIVEGYLQKRFYKRRKKEPICFSSINCRGVLTVTDSLKFTEMLFCGLGRSKSFGCGLMLVRKI
jgi:CRISPR system Cascade subunit CasE